MRAARKGGEIIKKHLDATTKGYDSSTHIHTKSSATHNHWYNGATPDSDMKARSEAIAEAKTEKKLVRQVTKTEGKATLEDTVSTSTDQKAKEVTQAIESVAKEAKVVADAGDPKKAEAMINAAKKAAVKAAEEE